MHYRSKRILPALFLLFLCSIAAFAQEKAAEAKQPDFQIRSVKLKGVDWSKKTADTLVLIVVKNPGAGFKLRELNYKLKVNDASFAEGKYDKEIEVPAKGEAELELPFTIDLTSIPLVAWNSVKDSLTLHYEIETEFKISLLAFLNRTQKASFNGDYSLTEALAELFLKVWRAF